MGNRTASTIVMVIAAISLMGATYDVGPGRTYSDFGSLPSLTAGDIVEIYGDHTYGDLILWDSGADGDPIIIRGVRVGGLRPVLSGGANTLSINGDHYVFEGLDITGGSSRCVFHHGHDVVIRDTVVHDCPNHGILGADQDSGSLTLEFVEVYGCGEGTQHHQIYMATDEVANPGSVFRMQFCYVHDGNGGNGVKTRAERNEIYYNWIEGSFYHELELIGPDPGGAGSGWSAGMAQENSDVVGNVLVKSGSNASFFVMRLGGDGTGETGGRYRFVNNTIVLHATSDSAVFRLFDSIQSIEAHNNVFYRPGSDPLLVFRDEEVDWSEGTAVFEGSNNWLASDATNVPAAWTGTVTGTDPGFTNVGGGDFTPESAAAALVDAGTDVTAVTGSYAFPTPLPVPAYHPPAGTLESTASARPADTVIDIGAYEWGSIMPSDADETPDAPADTVADTMSDMAADLPVDMTTDVVTDTAPADASDIAGDTDEPDSSSGCGCTIIS